MSPPVYKTCGKCKDPIKERAILYCITCKLHFHIDCKGYEKRYYLLDAERKSQWQCDVCIRKNSKARNARTPSVPARTPSMPKSVAKAVTKSSESGSVKPAVLPEAETSALDFSEDDEVVEPFQNVTLRGNSQKQNKHESVCSDEVCSAKGDTALEITTALKEYIAEQMASFTHQLIAKIDVLGCSIQSFNTRCENIEQRISSIEKRLDTKVDEKVNDLMATVDRLKCDLSDREQELLVNEFEISGVPEASGENPVHTVTIIGHKLGVKIADSDVVSAVRVGARHELAAPGVRAPSVRSAQRAPSTAAPGATATVAPGATATVSGDNDGGPRLLVVRLLRRAQCDELLRAARVRRGADTTGLDLPGPTRRFYVNERLTRANRLLFRRAREETRRLNWKFAWTRNGAILVRREHGEAAKRIRTEADLVKVFGVESVSEL